MATKLTVPAGCTSVSLEGDTYEVGAEGFVTIPDGLDVAPLMAHGLTVAGGIVEVPDDAEAARLALLAQARSMGLTPHYKLGAEKLQALIDEAKTEQAVPAAE